MKKKIEVIARDAVGRPTQVIVGDKLMSAAAAGVKTYRCKIRQERWSFETDADIIVSPSGKRLSIFAHDSVYENHPDRHIVQNTIERSWKAPKEKDGVNRQFGIVYLTKGEMDAWKTCWEAEQAHAREVRTYALTHRYI
jgi:hypothetical protein